MLGSFSNSQRNFEWCSSRDWTFVLEMASLKCASLYIGSYIYIAGSLPIRVNIRINEGPQAHCLPKLCYTSLVPVGLPHPYHTIRCSHILFISLFKANNFKFSMKKFRWCSDHGQDKVMPDTEAHLMPFATPSRVKYLIWTDLWKSIADQHHHDLGHARWN